MNNSRQFSSEEQEQQYEEWLAEQPKDDVDDASIKAAIGEELRKARSMTSKEFVLWKKWNSLQHRFPSHEVPTIDGIETQPIELETIRKLNRVQGMIWLPKHVDDYQKLEPELHFVKSEVPLRSVDIWGNEKEIGKPNRNPIQEDWRTLREFVSMAEYGSPFGRALNFLVRDRQSKMYLGLISVSSDYMDLEPRDKRIGWSAKERALSGRLSNLANGSTVVPTQPFGFNYVGGKLCALLCLSDVVSDRWQATYGDKLVGVTTTSLHGHAQGGSQYSGLRYWKSLGHSKGTVPFHLTDATEKQFRVWLRVREPRKYWEFFVAQDRRGMPMVRDSINRAYQFGYRRLGFKTDEFQSSHQRGVYFAQLYQNSIDYLRDEIAESELSNPIDNSVEHLVDLWRTKYATKRIEKLKSKNGFKPEILFQDDLIGLDWTEAKARYPI